MTEPTEEIKTETPAVETPQVVVEPPKEDEKPEVPEKIEPEVRGTGPEPTPEPKKEEGEDEEVLPEDKKVISRVVSEALSPLQKQLQEQADQAELTNFVTENPEYAKYKQSITVYMKHPAYRNIPVKNIAAIVASKDLQKIGAQKEREAQAAANATKGGGSSARVAPGGKDWTKASKEEFEAKRAEVFGRH
jgi:hypothetical protein